MFANTLSLIERRPRRLLGLRGRLILEVAHDAAAGSLGALPVSGAQGAVHLPGGDVSGLPGSQGGLFSISASGGTLTVSFDRAGLGDGFLQGESQVTEASITIADSQGEVEALLTIAVIRVNAPPILTGSLPDLTLESGVAASPGNLAGFFADQGDSLSFAASGLPAGLSLSSSGILSGTPTGAAGTHTVTVTATDSAAQSVSASLTIGIIAAAHAFDIVPGPGRITIQAAPVPPALPAVSVSGTTITVLEA